MVSTSVLVPTLQSTSATATTPCSLSFYYVVGVLGCSVLLGVFDHVTIHELVPLVVEIKFCAIKIIDMYLLLRNVLLLIKKHRYDHLFHKLD